MNYSSLWAKTTINKKLATDVLRKYGDVLKWKTNKSHVLEVGCGDGSLTNTILYPYIKGRVEKVVAIDKLPWMIDYAREHAEAKNIDFQTMDVTSEGQIRKMKEKFDHVFTFYAAHWILDQRTFLNNMYKMLKPDGQMLMASIVSSPFSEAFHRNLGGKSWSKYLLDERVFFNYTDDPAGFIGKVVDEIGFKVEVCVQEEKRRTVDNYPDFVRSMISLHPQLNRIPAHLQEDFFRTHLEYIIGKGVYLGEPNIYQIKLEELTCIASK